MLQRLVDFESIHWENPAPGVRFQAIVQRGSQLRLVEFTREFVEPDWCEKGHIGYVLDGEMEVNFNGEIQTYRMGQGIFITPGGDQQAQTHSLK